MFIKPAFEIPNGNFYFLVYGFSFQNNVFFGVDGMKYIIELFIVVRVMLLADAIHPIVNYFFFVIQVYKIAQGIFLINYHPCLFLFLYKVTFIL